MTRIGKIRISQELLNEMLHLPPHHSITGILPLADEPGTGMTWFTFLIEGRECPEVEPNSLIPEITIDHTREIVHAKIRRLK